MGNRCCGSFFGRVPTAEELKRTYPDGQVFDTRAGQKNGAQMRQAWVTREVSDKLTALCTLLVIYFILAVGVAGFGFSLVPGYAQVNDPAGTGVRVPHSIWFFSSAILIVLWMTTFFFDPYYQIARMIVRSRIFNGFLLIDFLQNLTHLVFTIIEVVQGSTGLASNTTTPQGSFFLIFLIVLLAIFVLWDILIYTQSANWATLLVEGVKAGWVPGAVGSRGAANDALLSSTGDDLATAVRTDIPVDVRIEMQPRPSSSVGGHVDSLLGRQRKRKGKKRN